MLKSDQTSFFYRSWPKVIESLVMCFKTKECAWPRGLWTVGGHAQYSWQRLSATILELGAQLKACWNSSTWARALLTLQKEHSNRLQHLQSETALFWQITDFSLYCTICVLDLRVLDIWRGIIAFVTVWLWRKTTSTPETITNKKTSIMSRVEDKGGEMWSTEGWRGCRTQTDGR